MRVLTAIFLSFTLLLSSAAAQEEPRQRLEQIRGRLNLTPDQTEKIRPILQEEATKLRGVRDKYQGSTARRDRLRMARELRDVQQDAEKRINPILNKEQRSEWKKIRDERRSELRERAQKKPGR